MGLWLKQSTAVTVKIGPFIDDTDGKTAENGLTLTQADIRLSKNGGDIAQKNEANNATTDEIGYYDCPINDTDTATLGRLQLFVHEAGALPVFHEYLVVPANVWDSYFSSDRLQIDVREIGDANLALSTQMKLDVNAEVDTALNTAIPANTANSVNDILLDQLSPRIPAAGTISVLDAAAVNAEVDGALNTAIPAVNTATSVNDILLDVLTLAAVNAEVDTALNTAIPGSPTANSVNERVATMDDAYTATRGGYLDELAAANLPTDVANVKAETALIVADTGELQADWVDGGRLDLLIDSTLADTNELQTDWANGGRLDLLIDLVLGDTNELQTDWANGGRLDLLIDLILGDSNELQTDWANGGRLDLILDAAAQQTSVDDLEGRLTAERAGYLDNLNNAQLLNVPDLSTLSAARIGYMDNLNQAGLLQVTAARAGYLDNINQAGLLQVTAARAGYLDLVNTNLNAQVSTRSSHSAADVWAVVARTLTDKAGFSLAADQSAVTVGTVNALSAAAVDSILDEAVEGLITWRQAARLLLSATSGKLSGAGTGTLTFRDANDTADRIVATVDANNNRTGMVLTV